jgi:hypothetical protein
MLYIIYAESANYCGYGQHFVVEADNETQAEELVLDVSEVYFCEQDESQLDDEGHDLDGMVYSNIITVEPFDADHDSWKYYQDKSQSEFYIKVNIDE